MPVARAEEIVTARIGFAGKLTDVLAQSAQQGAELAVLEANQQQKTAHEALRFELVPQNDHASPYMAVYVANYFVKTRVLGVIGHWSTDAALAVAPIYEKAGIAQINFTSTNSKVTGLGYSTTFRVVGGTAELSRALAEAAVDVLQGQRIAVIGNDSSYSKALSETFMGDIAARNSKVVQRAIVSAKTSDFNEELKAALQAQADVIFFSGYITQADAFMKATRRLNVQAHILLNGGAVNMAFPHEENGHLYTLEPDMAPQKNARWNSFERQFQAHFGHPSSTYSRQAYNATSMLIKAIRTSGGTDAEKAVQVLRQMRYTGMGCKIAFDNAGNNLYPTYTLYRADQQYWKAIQFFAPTTAARRSGECPDG